MSMAECFKGLKTFKEVSSQSSPSLPPLKTKQIEFTTLYFEGIPFHTWQDESGEIWWNVDELCAFFGHTEKEALKMTELKGVKGTLSFVVFDGSKDDVLAMTEERVHRLAAASCGKERGYVFHIWLCANKIAPQLTPPVSPPPAKALSSSRKPSHFFIILGD